MRAFSSGLSKEASKVIGAEPKLLGESIEGEILVEVGDNILNDPLELLARESVRRVFDGEIGGQIVPQQVNRKHLCCGFGIEFACCGWGVQFPLQCEPHLGQQRVLKTRALQQFDAGRKTISKLFCSMTEQGGIHMEVEDVQVCLE